MTARLANVPLISPEGLAIIQHDLARLKAEYPNLFDQKECRFSYNHGVFSQLGLNAHLTQPPNESAKAGLRTETDKMPSSEIWLPSYLFAREENYFVALFFAHFRLHTGTPPGSISGYISGRSETIAADDSTREPYTIPETDLEKRKEACIYADTLLMPEQAFKEAFQEEFQRWQGRMREINVWDSISDRFWVPGEVAFRRASDLGLVEKNPAELPGHVAADRLLKCWLR